MSTFSSTTADAVAPRPFGANVEAARLLDLERPRSAAARHLSRALEVVEDLATLVLLAWAVPFVILAVASPVVLIVWLALALIHTL